MDKQTMPFWPVLFYPLVPLALCFIISKSKEVMYYVVRFFRRVVFKLFNPTRIGLPIHLKEEPKNLARSRAKIRRLKMRILANYGYKNNGDTYSVTFETIGDVSKEHADSVVDELFAMAKTAIQRQINPIENNSSEFPSREETSIPQLKKDDNNRMHLKDPDAPATRKQKNLIIRLAKEKGQFIDNLDNFTMKEASKTIDELMTV